LWLWPGRWCDEQVHAVFLFSEDVLDVSADLRFGVVGASHDPRHRPVRRLLAAAASVLSHVRIRPKRQSMAM